MSSFGVKSLFTNVLLDELIETSTEQLYKMAKPSLKKKKFCSTFETCHKEKLV